MRKESTMPKWKGITKSSCKPCKNNRQCEQKRYDRGEKQRAGRRMRRILFLYQTTPTTDMYWNSFKRIELHFPVSRVNYSSNANSILLFYQGTV